MAFLYFPFYAAGYIWHYFIYGNGGSGMEVEYRTTMAFFGVFCLIIALSFLRNLLRQYFTETVVSLTLVLLVFGTNAFYYTTYEGCMSHIANFLLFVIFLRLTEKWHSRPSLINTLLPGLVLGLITLIRPTNILIGIFFLLYDVTSVQQLSDRIVLLLRKWFLLLSMSILAFMVWIPQMFYWHTHTGQYLFFSYVGEHFFFAHPRLYSGFFSFRKGWLIYTPIGSLMLLGFIAVCKYLPKLFWGSITFYIVTIYVMFSWWSWWYGGSFSCRPMVETYAVLAIPLACSLKFITEQISKPGKIMISFVFTILVAFNLFQTFQYSHQIIHWDRMSFAAYKNVFLRLQPAPDSLLAPPPRGVEFRELVE